MIKEIKINDNHKIPRKFRKGGFRFYITNKAGTRPECSGDNWISKNTYLKVIAFKDCEAAIKQLYSKYPVYWTASKEYDELGVNQELLNFREFNVLKKLCVVRVD